MFSDSIKLSLIDNAIHSLTRSIKHIEESKRDKYEWKFALMLVVNSIDLVCLELARVKSSEPIFYATKNGNVKAIQHDEAMKRVYDIFTEAEKAEIKAIRILRHSIVHYEYDLTVQEAKRRYYSVFKPLKKILDSKLNISLASKLPTVLLDVLKKMEFDNEEIRKRLEILYKERKINELELLKCPVCNEKHFVIMDREDMCFSCGFTEYLFECSSCAELEFESDMCYDPMEEMLLMEQLVPEYCEPSPICSACYKSIIEEPDLLTDND